MIQPVKQFSSDIDIDFADRTVALQHLMHTPASIITESKLARHATGVYVTDIPVDPFTNTASIDYKIAESRGYIKLDFLNVGVYSQVKSEQHLSELLHTEPPWDQLYNPVFCSKLIHIGMHYNTLIEMPEAVNTVLKLAMFLAVIRPAKRHLIGKSWQEVATSVWNKPEDGSYAFKKAHSVAYSHLVCVHMNLIASQE